VRHRSSPPSMAGSSAISEMSLAAALPAALWQRLGATQGNKAEQLKSLVLITTCRVLSPNGDCGLFAPISPARKASSMTHSERLIYKG
jgi:hypothetical protein